MAENLHSMDEDGLVASSPLGYEQLINQLHDGMGVRADAVPVPVAHLELGHLAHVGSLNSNNLNNNIGSLKNKN